MNHLIKASFADTIANLRQIRRVAASSVVV
jgi:hypothetical protein